MFQVNSQIDTTVRNTGLFGEQSQTEENTTQSFELASLWATHLLRQRSNLDQQYAKRHPLKVSVESIFYAR